MRMKRIKDDRAFYSLLNDEYKMLYSIGVSTGLRISDILLLTPQHFNGQEMKTIEKKTGKEKCGQVRAEVAEYVKGFAPEERIFKMSRQSAWKYFKLRARKLRLRCVGTHSMRKKYAHNLYEKTKDIYQVEHALNHDNISTTLLYLFEE